MNEEIGGAIKEKLLHLLLRKYQACQVHIRFIDDYNILQIMLCRKVTECTTWTYNRIYINPLYEAARDLDYVDDVYCDFVMHVDRWILNKFRRRDEE